MNATLTPQGMFMAMTCKASDDEICWNLSGQVDIPETGDSRDGWEVHGKTEVEKTVSKPPAFYLHTSQVSIFF
jgi:hypothetical protein